MSGNSEGDSKPAASGVASTFTSDTEGATPAQSPPELDAIVRQFRMNFSNDEIEKNGAMVADDVVVNVNGGASSKPNGATYNGRDQFVAWLKGVKGVFPDGKITEDEIVVCGDKAAVRFTLVGTQRGALPTPDGVIAPTGRTITLHAAEFFTFNAAGKVVHLENLTNDLSTVHQLTAE